MNVEPTGETCANAIVDTLRAHGLDTLYCLPGFQNDWLFNALFDAGAAVRAVHARHEQGAAYMALGAALATGRPAVYSVVPGPGVLNTTTALATAYSTNAPVLCLSGQIPSRAIGRGFGLLHEIPDQLGILERLTKRAVRVVDPKQASSVLAQAIHELTSGRPRPVAVEIPPDTLAARGGFSAAQPLAPAPLIEADAGAVVEAARLLAKAERPLIVVGGGALNAAEWVKTIAEQLQAPVLSYRMGRGTLDDRHPLSVTLPTGYRLWKDCDLVLGIGTRLQHPVQQWGVDDAMNFVRVEIDAEEMARVRKPDVRLLGHAEAILPKLAAEIDRAGVQRPSRVEAILQVKAEAAADYAFLEPQLSFLQAIRDALDEDGILVDELTQVGYVSRFAFPVYKPRTFISSGYQGTLGWGYATALGVQHARPDVPVVSINGDGGFMFTVQEMATAVRHRIPLVAIVFNDHAYGNVRRMQEDLYGNRVIATDLANPDFVALAKSFGVAAHRVQTPAELRKALETAFRAREPALVEVPCGPMPDPFRYIMAPRVRGAA